MSLETALQRISELTALVDPGRAMRPTPGAGTAFADQLAAAQSPAQGLQMNGSAPLGQVGVPGSAHPLLARMATAMPGQFGSAGAQALALAQREVGVVESPPGSNDSPRIAEYRTATSGAAETPGPWCAYFVSWLARGAGAPIGPGGAGMGYVPDVEQWARQNGRFYSGSTPQPGDVIVFQRNGADRPDHIGIVERVDPDGRVHTIEGNSSNSVARRSYPGADGQIRGYVRL